jgi:hypothetical protein
VENPAELRVESANAIDADLLIENTKKTRAPEVRTLKGGDNDGTRGS